LKSFLFLFFVLYNINIQYKKMGTKMRKDITKKFLMKENRYLKQMTSLGTSSFISKRRKKGNKKVKNKAFQFDYDIIEFANILNVSKKGCLNTKNNVVISGYKESNYISKNGKSISFNMVYCESGTFLSQGCKWVTNEIKNKKEFIEKPFWLGETEVTQEMYECVLGYNTSLFNDKNRQSGRIQLTSIRLGDTSKYPMEKVTWYDAIYFCNQLSLLHGFDPYYIMNDCIKNDTIHPNNIQSAIVCNLGGNGYRLPYDREWEYAAKAGTNNKYAGCDDRKYLSEYAWYKDNSNNHTHPVATKKPNEWGFYDMSGNVEEWCWEDDSIYGRQNRTRGGCYSTEITKSYINQKLDSNKLSTKVTGSWSSNAMIGDLGFRICRNA